MITSAIGVVAVSTKPRRYQWRAIYEIRRRSSIGERRFVVQARAECQFGKYCLRHGLKESQFHWWQRTRKDRAMESPDVGMEASFALVSKDSGALPGSTAAGIELLLSNGRRLRMLTSCASGSGATSGFGRLRLSGWI